MERFESALRSQLRQWSIVPGDAQLRWLRAHFQAVVQTNRQFNLTRVTKPEEAAVMLYADSLSAVAWASRQAAQARTVLDGGTGAGFPAVPVAVMQPRWSVTAVDGTGKKADFVASCARELGIANLIALHKRVEHLHPPPTYDLVLFKAVGAMAACLGWSRHLVSRGGYVLLYKTPTLPADEEEAGQRTAARLGFREIDRFDYSLCCNDETLLRVLRIFHRD